MTNILTLNPRPRLLLPPGAARPTEAAGVYTPPAVTEIRHEDATRLKDMAACLQRYKFKHIDGWRLKPGPGDNIDLWFGSALGAGLEAYWKGIIEDGLDCDAALRRAIRLVLSASWDDVAASPRYGRYETLWRCLGLEKYKNAAGRPAKCPYSHKGQWFPAPRPETCSCGSATTEALKWLPDNAAKDRVQLVRALVWYVEEAKAQPLGPVSMGIADGAGKTRHKALVEVPFRLPFATIGGVQFVLVGWWDVVAQAGQDGPTWIVDYKTTKASLSAEYFSQFQPNMQVDVYDFVAAVMLPTCEGVGIYGIQLGAGRTGEGWVRFAFKPFVRSPQQREEFAQELRFNMALALQAERSGYWPMNRTSCRFCEFKPVCNVPAAARPAVLQQNYERARWNPLTRTVELIDVTPDHTSQTQQPPHGDEDQLRRPGYGGEADRDTLGGREPPRTGSAEPGGTEQTPPSVDPRSVAAGVTCDIVPHCETAADAVSSAQSTGDTNAMFRPTPSPAGQRERPAPDVRGSDGCVA